MFESLLKWKAICHNPYTFCRIHWFCRISIVIITIPVILVTNILFFVMCTVASRVFRPDHDVSSVQLACLKRVNSCFHVGCLSILNWYCFSLFPGLISTEMSNYNEMRGQLKWITIFVVPETYHVIKNLVKECSNTATFNLFSCSYTRTSPLETFELSQTQNTNNVGLAWTLLTDVRTTSAIFVSGCPHW